MFCAFVYKSTTVAKSKFIFKQQQKTCFPSHVRSVFCVIIWYLRFFWGVEIQLRHLLGSGTSETYFMMTCIFGKPVLKAVRRRIIWYSIQQCNIHLQSLSSYRFYRTVLAMQYKSKRVNDIKQVAYSRYSKSRGTYNRGGRNFAISQFFFLPCLILSLLLLP